MALLQDLIQQIDDPTLRDRILQETNKLIKQKKFGLVFEEHLPECTPLYDVPIRVGSKVALKTGYVSDIYTVMKIDSDKVLCDRRETHEQKIFKMDEIVVVAEFGEPIYPTLKLIDTVENAPNSDLWHTLIEADNYHALQLLEYLYAEKVDCIYIDPPYNTGAKDWKYNNDYVDSSDAYRHSKWLSMMEKRLKIAKKLLNPKDSVLIVTIDEREYLHLGCLLEELFPEAHIQMISDLINRVVVAKDNEFGRSSEYIFIVYLGDAAPAKLSLEEDWKLSTQIFDVFGETVDNYSVHDMFTTTDTDIERQFQIADVKLGREGIGMAYGNKYGDLSDPTAFKVDVILFVADEDCMNRLHDYAEKRFHGLNDDYRRYIATIDSEKIRRDYDSIVSDGDVVSKHNFRLPETIQVPHEAGGKEYRDHLFVNETTGTAKLKLNGWEADLIAEEEKRPDFVCWIRNPSRASWALCIPYEIDGEIKPTYPDFIVVRQDERLGYVIDILEPHSADFKDNLGKAKGFAEYARQNPGVGRIQLIRMSKDAAGRNQFKRLDMYRTAIRDKVSHAINTDELDHIFDTDGVIE